jgi:elongation factor G
MPDFDTAHVKNIVLLGHAGCGKTSLAECMLYEAGLINRRGSVAEKNTTGDYHELEKERGNTIFSKLMHTKWQGYKINIIDTPGYDDFVGEVISALRVADTGVMLLNAVNGVEVGTDIIWDYTEQFKTPMLFAVNKLDDDTADFDKTVAEAKAHFGSKITVVQYPLNTGKNFNAIIDVLKMTMYQFGVNGGKPQKLPIPESEKEKADELHRQLVEAVAVNDETLMDHYLDKGELNEDEMKTGLHKSLINHDIFPVFCTSAAKDMGSGRIMGFIDNVCPGANEMPAQKTVNGDDVACNANGAACIFVYKTMSEPHVGELSFFKVYSGTIKAGMELVNENNGTYEKLNQLFVMEGNKRIAVNELTAGDIGATLKLKNTHVNNTLHEKGKDLELLPIEFPHANLTMAIIPIQKGEEEKLAVALHEIKNEDATLQVEVSAELKQTLIHCQGDMHLAVIKWKIEHLQKMEVKFVRPKIAYRETIRRAADSMYRHKKQSGGAGQFGEVHLRIEPWFENMPDPKDLNVRAREQYDLTWGGKLVYFNCIVGGAIDQRFLPSVLKGVMEKMQEGPLTGSFVRDVRVCVYDGKMHPVDSNDISFKIAGLQAFRQAFQQADPQILEPVYHLEVLCPSAITGSVISDLQTRRAVLEGMDTEGHFTKVIAKVPLAEMHGYSSNLRSFTHGRAKFRMSFADYEPVSFEVQRKLADEYSKVEKEELVA